MPPESISFEYNGATLTVKPSTIGSGLKRDQIIVALQADTSHSAVEHYLFARAVSQTTIDGDLGWTPPQTGDSADTVVDSFHAWLDLPEDLGDQWMRAVTAVNAPQTPPEYQPEVSDDADPE